jgi:hypothetical protein
VVAAVAAAAVIEEFVNASGAKMKRRKDFKKSFNICFFRFFKYSLRFLRLCATSVKLKIVALN